MQLIRPLNRNGKFKLLCKKVSVETMDYWNLDVIFECNSIR